MKKNMPSIFIAFSILCNVSCDQKQAVADLNTYPKSGQCAIDVPAKNAEIFSSDDFQVGGWAFNKVNNTVPDSLTIYFRNTASDELISASGQRGYKRPDVAKAFNIPALEDSGFNALVEKGKLPKGDYEIILVQSDKNVGAIICESDKHEIKIK